MANKLHWRAIKAIGIVLLIAMAVTSFLGHRLNSNPLLDCLALGGILFGISLLAFLIGGLPFQPLGASDKVIRWAFFFACFALAYGALQVPVWCVMTHHFPPVGMSDGQARVRASDAMISMFGPAAPLIVRMARSFRNKERVDDLRRHIAERKEPS